MPRYEVTSPDGKRWEVEAPEGATQDQVLAYAQQQFASQQKPAQQMSMQQPAAVQAGESMRSGLREIPRQAGLTGRYALEGIGSAFDLLGGPAAAIINNTEIARLAGLPKISGQPFGNSARAIANAIGLPEPKGATERVIGDAARMVASAGTGAGVASALGRGASGVAQNVAQRMAANPGTQAVSAAAAGGAGGSVREAGGGPWEQFGASLLAGVAAPLGMSAARNTFEAGANALKSRAMPTQELDARLSFELGKAGVSWQDLGAAVKMQLREDAKKAVVSGQPLDAAALRRLADYRNIGATPLLGDITQDPNILTQQRNLAKQLANTPNFSGANLPNIDNANARRVISTLEGASKSTDDAFTTGQRVIGSVQARDAAMKAQESALYGAARDSSGRALPLDRGAFLNEAFGNLAQNNKMAFLPEPVAKVLNQLGAGKVKVNGQEFDVPFDVNSIDQLKTMLATASRSTQDGNAKAAIKAVRDALENVQPRAPAAGGQQLATQAQAASLRAGDTAGGALEAFDAARSFARSRRQWQESAKFIEDALGGASPDSFVKKHVIGADVGELSKLRDAFAKSPDVLESVRKQLASHILERGRTDGDTVKFSSAGMQDALKAIGDRKLSLFFSPDEIQQLRSAVNVGRYMQAQPIGSAVNNSNTAGAVLGRLGATLDRISPIPGVGPLVAQPLQGGLLQLQMRGMNNVGRGLLAQPLEQQVPMSQQLMLPGLLAASPLLQQ